MLSIGLYGGVTEYGEAHLPVYCCAMVTEEGFADVVFDDLCHEAGVADSRNSLTSCYTDLAITIDLPTCSVRFIVVVTVECSLLGRIEFGRVE
jgi:hypothetical protein